MKPMRCALSAMLLAIFGASCAGGATTPPTLASRKTVTPVAATMRIVIPRRSGTRAPAYVSAATRSASISTDPASGCGACTQSATTAADLLPAAPNCVVTNGALVCTISLPLNPGDYTATVTLYDGSVANNAATGNALSTATFALAVKAGTLNTYGVTLGGIPADIALSLPSSQGYAVNGGLRLLGIGTNTTLTATALDARGNVIFGPGAPSISASISGKAGYSITSTSNGVITLKPPLNASTNSDTLVVTLGSSTCGMSGAVCAKSFPISLSQFIAIAYPALGAVAIQSIGGSFSTAIIPGGGFDPALVRFDSEGSLFIADQGHNSIYDYLAPYTGSPFASLQNVQPPNQASGAMLNGPTALAFEANRALDVANYNGNSVTQYIGPYYQTPVYDTLTVGVSGPMALIVEPKSGALDVANFTSGTVKRYTGPLSNPTSVVTLGGSVPYVQAIIENASGDIIAAGGDGDIGVTYASGGSAHINVSNANFKRLAIDGAQRVFVTDTIGNAIYRLDPPGYTAAVKVLTLAAAPKLLAIDRDDNLYVSTANSVAVYAPPYTGAPTVPSLTWYPQASDITIWP